MMIEEVFNSATQRFYWKPCVECGDTGCQGHIYRLNKAPSRPSLSSLLEAHGSFRRLCAAYWGGKLSPEEERIIEERHAAAELASYKPVEGRE